MAGTELGYYTLPVILSFDGVDKQVNSTLGKAFSGDSIGKKFGKDLAAGVKSTEADIKRAFENHAKLADRAADATGKLRAEQAKLDDLSAKGVSGGRLVQQMERVEKARRDETRATRSATDALKDYEAAAKGAANASDGGGGGLLDKLKGFAGSASSAGSDAATGFVEGFGGPIADIGTKGGPIGLALAAAAVMAAGAGVAIGTQVMAGMEREVASDRIAAQLGLSPEQSAQYGESAGRVYANNFGDSLSDVNEAMAQVASTLGKGMPPEIMEEMTAKALAFRDVFGTEVSESIAHAQNLITNGLAPDAASAFDLMTTAYQRVPAAMRDELPEILNEYSTNFQSLGFSGQEAFGMLVNAAPKGKIALDKIGDALKEFSLLATDIGAKPVQDALASLGLDGAVVANNLLAGGESAQQQFSRIVDGLLQIPDPAKQAEAAIALFGTPLEDLDKAKIPEFLRSLDTASDSMDGFAGSTEQMLTTAGDNAAGSVESAKRAIENAMGGMQDTLAQAFGPYVEQFAQFLTENQDEIVAAFTWIAGAATEFGAAVGMATGGAITALGTFLEVTGDVSGWIIDGFEGIVGAAATMAEAFGQDGMAADLREAQQTLGGFSDKLHGLGEGVTDFGLSIGNASNDLRTWDASLVQSEASAKNAAAQIERTKAALGALPNAKNIDVNAIVVFKDATGKVIPPDQLISPSFVAAVPGETRRPSGGGRATGGRVDPNGMIRGPGTGTSDSILARVFGSSNLDWINVSAGEGIASERAVQNGWPLIDALNKGWVPSPEDLRSMLPGFADGGALGLNPGAAMLSDSVKQLWPQITNIGGRRSEDGFGEHSTGNAVDIMIPNYSTPEGKALGDAVASWLVANKDAWGLDGMIWRQTQFGYGGSFTTGTPMGNRGSDTQNHMDHIHAILGQGRGAGAPAVDVPTQSISLPSGGSYAPGSAASGSSSGAGTPGYGPNGQAGYYEAADPKKVREAEQKVADADARVREAEARQRELDADAKESQRISAQNNLDKAKREAEDARADLEETKKGTFKEGSTSSSSGTKSSGQGGMGQFGELGSILGSFFKETFGFDGSFLPDLSSLAPVQMAGNLLNAFAGPLQGFVDGQLGVQQPGWQPGMPVNGVENDTGIGGTSNAPFGIPDVAVPPMPEGNAHPGTGAAPGPVQNVTIDQSINGGNFGWGHDDIEKRRRNDMNRAGPRIPAIR